MSDEQVGVILEDIQGKLQSLAEVVSVIQQDVAEMKPQLARIDDNTADIKTIQRVVSDHSGQLKEHEDRLQTLEMPSRA